MNDRVKQQIFEKFRDLSFIYGLKRITIDTLAHECGISKKTIYKYYQSKDDMVYEIADGIFSLLKSSFDSVNKSEENPLQKLHHCFEISFSLFRNFSTILLEDVHRFYPDIASKLTVFINELSSLFMENYTRGVQMGLFIELNPYFVSGFFKGASETVFKPEFILQNNLTIEETIASFRTMLMSSLSNKAER